MVVFVAGVFVAGVGVVEFGSKPTAASVSIILSILRDAELTTLTDGRIQDESLM